MNNKLLFIGMYPPPYGGISSHLYDLLPDLNKNGFNTHTITFSTEEKYIEKKNISNEYLNKRKLVFKHFFKFIYFIFRFLSLKKDLTLRDYIHTVALTTILSKKILKINPKDVFFYTYSNSLCIPMLNRISNFKDIPFHSMLFAGPYKNPDYYISIKKYLSLFTYNTNTLLASSDYCACALNNTIGLKNDFRVIYIGIDTSRYNPLNSGDIIREKFNISSKSKVVLFLGRMNPEMGLDLFLDNYNKFLDLDKSLEFIVAGATGPLSSIALKISEKNSRIHFLENFDFEIKPQLYACSDILIAPTFSKHACMGVSIKEAMASGVPVIASDSGGINEAVLDGITGYVIPIKNDKIDIKLIFKKISILLNDEVIYERMSAKSISRALKLFSREAVVNKYLKIIKTK